MDGPISSLPRKSVTFLGPPQRPLVFFVTLTVLLFPSFPCRRRTSPSFSHLSSLSCPASPPRHPCRVVHSFQTDNGPLYLCPAAVTLPAVVAARATPTFCCCQRFPSCFYPTFHFLDRFFTIFALRFLDTAHRPFPQRQPYENLTKRNPFLAIFFSPKDLHAVGVCPLRGDGGKQCSSIFRRVPPLSVSFPPC